MQQQQQQPRRSAADFHRWLRAQSHRQDKIGRLARTLADAEKQEPAAIRIRQMLGTMPSRDEIAEMTACAQFEYDKQRRAAKPRFTEVHYHELFDAEQRGGAR